MKPKRKDGFVTIEYGVDDGYVRGARPQYLQVPKGEWDEMDQRSQEDYVRDMIIDRLTYEWKVVQ